MLGVVCVVGAAVGAAVGVRGTAHSDGGKRVWWVAGVLGGGASWVAFVQSPVPAAAALAAGGMAAASVVDIVEFRIPTPVAHLTTAISLGVLGVYAAARHDWGGLVVRPVLLAAVLMAVFIVLWLPGWVGFGDVRLAAATVTAMVPGSGGPIVVGWLAFAVSGLAVLVLRATGKRSKDVPFGPGLAIGWLVAVALTYS